MEFNDFLSVDYVASYLGSIVVIMLITQFVKELPLISKLPTKYLVLSSRFTPDDLCSA